MFYRPFLLYGSENNKILRMNNLKQVFLYADNKILTTPGNLLAYSLPRVGTQLGWLLTGFIAVVLII